MRGRIALVIAAGLALQLTAPASAKADPSQASTATSISQQHDAERPRTLAASVRVFFNPVLPHARALGDGAFTLTVTDSAGAKHSQKLAAAGLGFSATAEDLPAGSATVTVTASGFGTYTQKIELAAGREASITIADSYRSGMDFSALGVGLMPYGDFNADGAVDAQDAALLTRAVVAGTTAAEQPQLDVNDDGSIDLVDVRDLAATLDAASNAAKVVTAAAQVTFGDDALASMEAAADEGTTLAEGSDKPSELLTNSDASVHLAPANGQDISPENPVSLTIQADGAQMEGVTVATPAAGDGQPKTGVVAVELEDSSVIEASFGDAAPMLARAARAAVSAKIEADGTVVVDFGRRVAVKRITIKVTATASNKLADIGQVKFYDDMASRIPAPEMSVPANLKAAPANEEVTLTWDAQTNVTGYEVEVALDGKKETHTVAGTTLTVGKFAGKELINGTGYAVRVRSVNGEWKSPWSSTVTATPQANKAPDAPENVTVNGAYRSLKVTWKNVKDTEHVTLYYRAAGTDAWSQVELGKVASYTVEGLADNTSYEVKLTASNAVGTSKDSAIYTGKTVTYNVKVPWYNLINRTAQDKNLASHIVDVKNTYAPAAGSYEGTFDPRVMVDGDYSTSYVGNRYQTGVSVTFDKVYRMNSFALSTDMRDGYGNMFYNLEVTVTDGAGKTTKYSNLDGTGVSFYGLSDVRNSIMVKFPVSDVKKITFEYSRYYWETVTISELAFYEYSEAEEAIDALWADDLHTTLADGVTAQDIKHAEDLLNTPDPASNEYHPRREIMQKDLDAAKDVLANKDLRAVQQVSTSVSLAYDQHVDFGGLNAWQPLGITAKAGDQLKVFAAGNGLTTGEGTNMKLIATQYHAESSSWNKVVIANLKVGMNEVTIPAVSSLGGEQGGALYVEYTGNNRNAQRAVRVLGGQEIPVLDLSGVTDEAQRLATVRAYLEKLDAHVAALEQEHKAGEHTGSYDAKNCISNATDIITGSLMYSVPASQIKAGSGTGDLDARAKTLLTAADAAEQAMKLFYQHKGLGTYNAGDKAYQRFGNTNALPTGRQNIRYMRMFSGAFMYAGGLHIGIEWNETQGLAKFPGITATAEGKYQGGWMLGWGIAHEIGHEINSGAYVVPEITNNYFAQLTASQDTNDSTRWKDYNRVWEKVTSGTKGDSANGAVQLALYWQLHLAYDNGYNFKTYDDYAEQFDNLFWARVDAYVRNPEIAPGAENNKLNIKGASGDQALMRLACAAANKNILAFFEAWGKTPDAQTRAYAEQFEIEGRPIQYITDDARVYRIENGSSVAQGNTVKPQLTYTKNSNKVQIDIKLDGTAAGMLGYEIRRNGVPVGFAQAGEDGSASFTDTVVTANNRVFTYSVVGVDNLLATTKEVTMDPVKVSHDGALDKGSMSAATNMTSADDDKTGTETDPCEPAASAAIDKVIDDEEATVYEGEAASGDATVTLSLGDVIPVTGVKYAAGTGKNPAIGAYTVEASADGGTWQTVKTGTFASEPSEQKVVFNKEGDGRYLTYDAAYLRITATGQSKVRIAELSVLGNLGDDIDWVQNGYGLVSQDTKLADGEVIPAGSLVFTGTYTGNPAYNAIKLYDQDGNIVSGTQVIFAEVPDEGELGNTADGTWLYYIEPEDLAKMALPKSVSVDLFRVDDAATLEGERLVAQSLPLALPANKDDLPSIKLDIDGKDAARSVAVAGNNE